MQPGQYRTILRTYLKPLWGHSALLLLLLLLGTGLQLLNPQILARFIDLVVTGGSMPALGRLAMLFLGLALLRQVSVVGEAYLAGHIGLSATNQLRADLALHCLQLDMGFHNNHTPGELIERVDGDVGLLTNFFSRFMVELLGSGLLLSGVFVALFQIDWRVGLVLSGFTLLVLFIVIRLRDRAVPYFRRSRQAGAALFGFLEERLSGTEDVRANGAGHYVMRRFFERARTLLQQEIRARLMATGVFGISSVLFTLGTIVALGLGAYFFLNGIISIGTVYLIYRYMELITLPLERINRQIQDLQLAGAALIRIQDILARRSRLADTGQTELPASALAVDFDQVSFAYTDGLRAAEDRPELVLDQIAFSLPPGTTLGLLGRTGSGKTTLTRLLFRFFDPTQGAVALGGVKLTEAKLASIRQRVGVVTQEIQLFHASLRDNLTLFDPTIAEQQIVAVLEALDLAAWYRALPDGLDTVLAAGGGGLSAGEAQLLALGRVFLKDPGLVILDEASARLDPATEQRLEQAIARLLAGRTAIIIAHRLATVQRAEQIMILDRGRCLEYGRRQELAQNPRSHFARLLQTGLEEALA